MDLETRRSLIEMSSQRPTADWTVQQFRKALPGEHPYRFVIHDRDSIFSGILAQSVTAMGVRVLRTPGTAPHKQTQFLSGWLARCARSVLIL
jgi:hypothetical protein